MWGFLNKEDKQELNQMASGMLEATKSGDQDKAQEIKDKAAEAGYQMTQVGEEVQIRCRWWK